MEFVTKKVQETQKLGEEIGNNLDSYKTPEGKALIFALTGDLGSGKTTFAQGFAKGLGIDKRVLSPTFILMRKYKIKTDDFSNFYHVDLYRLEEGVENEFKNLGLYEIFNDSRALVLIEWAEKAREFLPEWAIWMEFEQEDKERKIKMKKNK